MDGYIRQPVASTLPGLTEEETSEMYRLGVEGSMFGYYSLGDNKLNRLLELQGKMKHSCEDSE